jgi:hypothetical protein
MKNKTIWGSHSVRSNKTARIVQSTIFEMARKKQRGLYSQQPPSAFQQKI